MSSIAFLCAAPLARAQAERWAVVPVVVGAVPSDAELERFVTPIEVELRARGLSTLGGAEAIALVRTSDVIDPVELDTQRAAALQRALRDGQRALALGETTKAAKLLEPIRALTNGERDALVRDDAAARRVFNACVLLAYSARRRGGAAAADAQMTECVKQFPAAEPQATAYPEGLIELFKRVQGEANAALTVTTPGNTCTARLNGVAIGKTPVQLTGVHPGLVRVQVECAGGPPGRVHVLDLQGNKTMQLDPGLDGAVNSASGRVLSLRYASFSERDRSVLQHGAALRTILGVTHVALLAIDSTASPNTLVRIGAEHGRAAGQVTYAAVGGYASGVAREVVRALVAPAQLVSNRSTTGGQLSSAEPARQRGSGQPWSRPQPSQQHLLPGLVLAGLGVGGLTASWLLYSERQDIRLTPRTELSYAARDSFQARGTESLVMGIAGSAALSLSHFFWLPDAPGVPAWAWIVGGAGLVGTGVGVAYAAWGTHCGPTIVGTAADSASCASRNADSLFGPLVILTAAPFLLVPVSYAIRSWLRPRRIALNVRVTQLGGYLELHGHF